MADRGDLKLGALGGPATFGAQAAVRLKELYPEFTEISYFPTSEAAMDGDPATSADAACAPEQMKRTGFHPGIQARVATQGSNKYVLAEVSHAYHASLLLKPGARVEDVRTVLGHTGSITQSRHWLEANLPQAEIVIVDTSSHGAAQTVVASDGSLASVGTHEAAQQFGLVEAATDIDGGSVANYWAISYRPLFDERPTRLVVTLRSAGEGGLTDLIVALAPLGFRVQTIFSLPTGQGLFEYDYTLRFGGSGSLAEVQQAVASVPTARLAGAFQAREE
jgi:prephenate dehydratase